MTVKHTPGPWRVRDGQDIRRPHNILSHGGALVALAYWDSDLMEDSDEPEANAALIAAAPDLYEALIALVGDKDGQRGRDQDEAEEMAHAALRKAEASNG